MDVDLAMAGPLSSFRGFRTSHYKFHKIQISSDSLFVYFGRPGSKM